MSADERDRVQEARGRRRRERTACADDTRACAECTMQARGAQRHRRTHAPSLRTSYASAISRNLSAAPASLFLSGWNLSASLRYLHTTIHAHHGEPGPAAAAATGDRRASHEASRHDNTQSPSSRRRQTSESQRAPQSTAAQCSSNSSNSGHRRNAHTHAQCRRRPRKVREHRAARQRTPS